MEGDVEHEQNVFSSNRSSEDDAVVETLLFEDSDNNMMPSESGLSESYPWYVQKYRKSVI
jgi:hypothetical protein